MKQQRPRALFWQAIADAMHDMLRATELTNNEKLIMLRLLRRNAAVNIKNVLEWGKEIERFGRLPAPYNQRVDKTLSPRDYLENEYGELLRIGFQPRLIRQNDKKFYSSLHNWCSKHGIHVDELCAEIAHLYKLKAAADDEAWLQSQEDINQTKH